MVFDNWSVNFYFDNQPGGVVRSNIISFHPPDPANYLHQTGSPWTSLGKYTVCMMLADEEWSSDATNGYANLDRVQVYNNLLTGCRIGIRDHSEGDNAAANHGLKNALIANNTIVTAYAPITGSVLSRRQALSNSPMTLSSVSATRA